MKKSQLIFTLFSCLFISGLSAQTTMPQGFNYQCIIRNAEDDKPSKNEEVSLTFTIFDESPDGPVAYKGEVIDITNEFGLINHIIGQNEEVIEGDFATINWQEGNKFLQVHINGMEAGTNPLVYVPFAFHAQTVEHPEDDDANPENELQTISKEGSIVTMSHEGGSFIDEVNDADADPNNEDDFADGVTIIGDGSTTNPFTVNQIAITPLWEQIQNRPVNLDTNYLDDFSGNWVDLADKPEGFADNVDNVNDDDDDPTNEDDTADGSTILGDGIIIPFNINHANILPEWGNIQNMPPNLDLDFTDDFTGNWENLFNIPANIDLDVTDDFNGKWGSLSDIPAGFADNFDNVNDADSNPSNELQNLTLSSNILGLTNSASTQNLNNLQVNGDVSGILSNLQLGANVVSSNEISNGSIQLWDLAAGIIPSSLPPSGAASGDLGGSYPTPIVDGIRGRPVSSTTPWNGSVLKYINNQWQPATDQTAAGSGGVSSCGKINSPQNEKAVGIGNVCADNNSQMYVRNIRESNSGTRNGIRVEVNNNDTQSDGTFQTGLLVDVKNGSNSNDGVILLSQSDNGASGMKVSASSNGVATTGLHVVSGGLGNESDFNEINNGNQNLGLYIDLKENPFNNNATKYIDRDVGLFVNAQNGNNDYAAVLKGRVVVTTNLYSTTTTPQNREFSLIHGSWSGGGNPNQGHGLKIENSGHNKTNWTLYSVNSTGALRFYVGNTWRCEFSPSTGEYIVLSDAREKHSVNKIENILPKVMNLSPKSYIYKSDSTNRRTIGLMAQEVEPLFPECVYKTGEDLSTYGISYSGFGIIAIKAIQEQQEIIEQQQATIEGQESRLKNLELEMAELKALLQKAIPANTSVHTDK